MKVELSPKIGALLEAEVAAGHYRSVEQAIAAAVLGVPPSAARLADLSWAKPFLDEADREIDAGLTLSDEETFGEIEKWLSEP